MKILSKEQAKLIHNSMDIGSYEVVYVFQAGLVYPCKPLKTISESTVIIYVVEDFYLYHGNGD